MAGDDPPRGVVERRKAAATVRPSDRRDIEARRQAEIAIAAAAGAQNVISSEEGRRKSRTLLSRRNNLDISPSPQIRRNERSSGSLCSAAARDPESAGAGIGPAEAGERDPRR